MQNDSLFGKPLLVFTKVKYVFASLYNNFIFYLQEKQVHIFSLVHYILNNFIHNKVAKDETIQLFINKQINCDVFI